MCLSLTVPLFPFSLSVFHLFCTRRGALMRHHQRQRQWHSRCDHSHPWTSLFCSSIGCQLSVVGRCHWSSSLLTVLFLFFLLHDHSEFFLFYFCCIFGARFEDYWLLAPNWLCCRWLLLLANKWTDAITIKRLGRWLCIDWFLLLFFIFFFAVASLIGRVLFFCFSLGMRLAHGTMALSLSLSLSLCLSLSCLFANLSLRPGQFECHVVLLCTLCLLPLAASLLLSIISIINLSTCRAIWKDFFLFLALR